MINERWIKLSDFKSENLDKIENCPDNWLGFDLEGPAEDGFVRFFTGADLLASNFGFSFFQKEDTPGNDKPFTWLIFLEDAEQREEIKNIILKHAATREKTFWPMVRHPLIKYEDKWVNVILDKFPNSKIYANYEFDDILVREKVKDEYVIHGYHSKQGVGYMVHQLWTSVWRAITRPRKKD